MLPPGSYHFCADRDGQPYWSLPDNHCTLPGCTLAGVVVIADFERVETSITYTYAPLSRLTGADYDTGYYYHYTYDANGNRQSETTTAGTVTSVYDSANRLTSVSVVAYVWDDNGNLRSDGVRSYEYDHANRLTSVIQGSDTTVYTYNGMGDRVSETVNGVTNHFALNLNTGLTQVLQDGTNTYLYGNGRIGQFAPSETAYFLGDGLGSVRQLTGGSGALTLTKEYEPYGEVMSSLGNGASSYGYTGEWASSSTNLVYLRSRFYSPSTGRFQTKDSWQGDYSRSLSLNKWMYVEGNPINLTDPTGKTPLTHTFDGYLVGRSSARTIPALLIGEQLRRAAKERLGEHGCQGDLRPNGVIEGEETVYDFVHLQKAKFKYKGIIMVPFSIGQWDWSAYDGVIWGFANFPSIENYEGFSLSAGLEGHFWNFVGIGATWNQPMDEMGRNVVDGVSSITMVLDGGAGAGGNTFLPVDGSVAISFYELDGEIEEFYFLNGNDRNKASQAMLKDMDRTVKVKTPFLDWALQSLYYRTTGEDLYKDAW